MSEPLGRRLRQAPWRLLLVNFHWLYRVSQWSERRFTPGGRFLLGFLAIAGAMGVDVRLNLAHQLFTLGAALLLLAVLWAPSFQTRFQIRRQLPRYASVDQPLRYRLWVTSRGRRPQRGLTLLEEIAAPRPSVALFLSAREPQHRAIHWFDRVVGYPRWVWLMRRQGGALVAEQALPELPPGREVEVQMGLLPLRRGYVNLSAAVVARPDPLGIFRAFFRARVADRLLVLPRRYPVSASRLPGGRRYQRGGVSLAAEIGESEEFAALRDYRPGDPMRHIHWKSLAKTGRPIVKTYQDEFFVRHALILDTFIEPSGATVSGEPAFEAAVSVAASYAAAIDTKESLLDLLFVGAQAYRFTCGRGVAVNDHLLEVLACVEPCTSAPFQRLTDAVSAQRGALSGCICILLGWDAPRQALVRQLTQGGVPCLVLVVAEGAPAEALDPGPLGGRPEHLRRLRPGHLQEDLRRL
jgi:uncharacterized protein (DUF58 family)